MLDHVAILVEQIEPALARLEPLGLDAGPIEDFPGEGTREVYLGEPDRPGRLLLMQALGEEGPYARALAKRGPGLHHVGLRVPDLDAFLKQAAGWLLHPCSFDSRAQSNTIWLARPGIEVLVEASQSKAPFKGSAVVEELQVAAPAAQARLLTLLGLARAEDQARLRVGATWLTTSLSTR